MSMAGRDGFGIDVGSLAALNQAAKPKQKPTQKPTSGGLAAWLAEKQTNPATGSFELLGLAPRSYSEKLKLTPDSFSNLAKGVGEKTTEELSEPQFKALRERDPEAAKKYVTDQRTMLSTGDDYTVFTREAPATGELLDARLSKVDLRLANGGDSRAFYPATKLPENPGEAKFKTNPVTAFGTNNLITIDPDKPLTGTKPTKSFEQTNEKDIQEYNAALMRRVRESALGIMSQEGIDKLGAPEKKPVEAWTDKDINQLTGRQQSAISYNTFLRDARIKDKKWRETDGQLTEREQATYNRDLKEVFGDNANIDNSGILAPNTLSMLRSAKFKDEIAKLSDFTEGQSMFVSMDDMNNTLFTEKDNKPGKHWQADMSLSQDSLANMKANLSYRISKTLEKKAGGFDKLPESELENYLGGDYNTSRFNWMTAGAESKYQSGKITPNIFGDKKTANAERAELMNTMYNKYMVDKSGTFSSLDKVAALVDDARNQPGTNIDFTGEQFVTFVRSKLRERARLGLDTANVDPSEGISVTWPEQIKRMGKLGAELEQYLPQYRQGAGARGGR